MVLKCVLQCVAMRGSMLQFVAVCCSVLQCAAVCCHVLPCCSVLVCVTVCCSVLQLLRADELVPWALKNRFVWKEHGILGDAKTYMK